MNLITGFQLPPWLVALGRGIVIAVLYAAINSAILYFSESDVPGLVLYQPFIVIALRQLEGLLDQATKKNMNQLPPE